MNKFRIAILGGAFDPITEGHVAIANYVINACDIFDEVWVIPCYKHMSNKKMADPSHRLAMCKLATKTENHIRVSPYEIDRKLSGESYCLIQALKNEALPDYDFSFIIGMDNANTFHQWANYEELQRTTKFVVVPRPGIEPKEDVRWYSRFPHMCLLPNPSIPNISSTMVRECIKKGDPVKGVNPQVLEYIKQHNLYLS